MSRAQCRAELKRLVEHYKDAFRAQSGDGETIEHAICTTLMTLDLVAEHCQSGLELRLAMSRLLGQLVDGYLNARLDRAVQS